MLENYKPPIISQEEENKTKKADREEQTIPFWGKEGKKMRKAERVEQTITFLQLKKLFEENKGKTLELDKTHYIQVYSGGSRGNICINDKAEIQLHFYKNLVDIYNCENGFCQDDSRLTCELDDKISILDIFMPDDYFKFNIKL